jgi:hypothetical protein
MNRAQHPTNNFVLGAPKGWDQGNLECGALPVTRTEWHGVPACVSWWVPTDAERKAIAEGAAVRLWVAGSGQQHPPVAIDVEEKA